MYHADHGTYPVVNGWSGDTASYGGHGYTADDPYIPGLIPDYIAMLPRDPNRKHPADNKGYLYKSNGTDFKVLAYGTPTTFPTDHRYYDPTRPTYAYQVSSKGGAAW